MRNPDTGGIFTFGEPMHPGVQAQIEAGHLLPVGTTDVESSGRPKPNAALEKWIKFAISQGIEEDEARGMSKAELRERFTPVNFAPEVPPEVA